MTCNLDKGQWSNLSWSKFFPMPIEDNCQIYFDRPNIKGDIQGQGHFLTETVITVAFVSVTSQKPTLGDYKMTPASRSSGVIILKWPNISLVTALVALKSETTYWKSAWKSLASAEFGL